MLKEIELYIAGKKADIGEEPILYTYETTDYTNPTVVKNSFSKTVELEGTPSNDRIFNELWHLDRVMDNGFSLFNPSQRVPFALYKNGEVLESGYAKLDSIKSDANKRKYSVTLYGGLGGFLYSLDYDTEISREKTLADLNFTMQDGDQAHELDFVISKGTVNIAWDYIGQDLWSIVNFVPCYGMPQDFDTNRVLVNTNGMEGIAVRYTTDEGIQFSTFPSAITSNNVTYTTKNGYVNATMRREMGEWEMRDLRSYMQRPAVSVESIIRAICQPENNGGYEVDLDTDFFSSGNPYYSKAWMTLPLLGEGVERTDTVESWNWTLSEKTGTTSSPAIYYAELVEGKQYTPDSYNARIKLYAEFTNANESELYMQTYLSRYNRWIQNALVIQMYGATNDATQEGLCGSDKYVFTTRDGNEYISAEKVNSQATMPFDGTMVNYIFGKWVKDGSRYKWVDEGGNDTFNMVMYTNDITVVPFISVCVQRVVDVWNYNIWAFNASAFASKTNTDIDSAMLDARVYGSGTTITDEGSSVVYQGNGTMHSYQTVTKQTLFGGLDITPCDFLLSYCKLFGLHIFKDKVENRVYIRMRKNFYVDGVVDIDDDVDVSAVTITPLAFDSKWYSFNYLENEGELALQYGKRYGNQFGTQLVDTRYNFDSEKVDLLEGTIFKNAATVLEKSNYFNNKYDTKNLRIPQFLFDWSTVRYYNNGDSIETNMALPQGTVLETLNEYMPNEFWDRVPKLQLHNGESSIDGDCILVFFDGMEDLGVADVWLSDDIDDMFDDSENPCWLSTQSQYDISGNTIAIHRTSIPSFSRYVTKNTTWPLRWNTGKTWQSITADWDFGRTKELYVPYFKFDNDKTPTIYENFWKSYINDLYSIDTRKVDANIVLRENDVYGALRRFYWFSNCWWVMTKITDYDVTTERLTKCSFTKVNDIGSYLEDVTFDDNYFDFRRVGNNLGVIPASGTTEELTVDFEVDCYTDWQVRMSNYTTARFANGAGYYSGHAGKNHQAQAIFFPNSGSERTLVFSAIKMDDEEMITITVTQAGAENKYLRLINQYQEPPYTFNISTPYFSNSQITVYSSDDWVADYDAEWMTNVTTSGTSGESYFRFDALQNDTGRQRKTVVKFDNGYVAIELEITQPSI